MAAIRGKDTKPELVIRRALHRLGYRYQLHRNDLPGKPDLVFSSLRKIVFVHGCFWHMHRCPFGKVTPATRSDFWLEKRTGNVLRDRRNKSELRKSGWKIFEVWECSIRHHPDLVIDRIAKFLQK